MNRPVPERAVTPEEARLLLLGHNEPAALEAFARTEGVRLFLAGGAVRDLLLGIVPTDLDFVSAAGTHIARRFADAHSLPFVMLDEDHGVARVVAPGLVLDFSAFRAQGRGGLSDIEADLLERDFTINSMAVPLEVLVAGRFSAATPPVSDPILDAIIDPAGGLADLRAKKILRATSSRGFQDDPLRSLRLYRLAAQLGFQVEPLTRQAAWAGGTAGLHRVAGERIRAELAKMLSVPRSIGQLREMTAAGLLGLVLSGIEDMRGVEQRGYHHLDVLEHALATVEAVENCLADPAVCFPCPEYFFANQTVPPWLLKLAALLHDAGKPETAIRGEDHVSFHGHEERGEEIARLNAERLKLSRAEADALGQLVGQHMRAFHLVRLLRLGKLTDRALRRLLDAAGDCLPSLFLLAMADSLAATGPDKPADSEEKLAELFCLASRYLHERLKPLRARPRLLTGHDLLQVFGLQPGPRIKQLLQEIEDARLAGEVESREDALDLVARLLKG
ncbi:MAG: HD domain-containing protein [Pseudomonadota bacterium]